MAKSQYSSSIVYRLSSLFKESSVKHSRFQFPKLPLSNHFSYWLIFMLIFSLALVACERTIPEPEEREELPPPADQVPVEDPFSLPDPDPVPAPTNGYPAPEEPAPAPVEETPPVAEEPAPESEPEAPQPTPPLELGGSYTVQAGDTLFSIAQRYGITVQALATANNIVNVNRLDIGQVLTIPAEGDTPPPTEETGEEQIHVVQPGDTLFRIALRYGVTVEALVN
jgi:LysM repeat protein